MRVAGRPFAILVLAVLAVAGALWALVGVAGLRPTPEFVLRGVTIAPEVVRTAIAAWAVMLLAGAVLLVVPHRWGWVLLMLASGTGLLAALWQWFLGNPEPVVLALLVVTAFYLNGSQVRALLLPATERSGAVPLAPSEGGL